MKWEQKLVAPFVLAALLLLLLSVYVASYFWLSEDFYSIGHTWRGRAYPYRWMAVIFYPAAKIEGAIRDSALDTTFTVSD